MLEKKARKFWSSRIVFALFALFVSGIIWSLPALALDFTRDDRAPVQSSVNAPDIPDNPADLEADDPDDVEVVSGAGGMLFAVSPSTPQAKDPSRAIAENRLNAFNASQPNKWQATFNDRTGKVKLLAGALSKEYGKGPENTARSFLSESTALFGLQQGLSDLKTARVDVTPERDHVRFQQIHNGVPVVGAFVIVHVNKKSQVTMVQNGHAGEIQTVNSDLIAEAVAADIARNDLKAALKESTVLIEGKHEKLVSPQDGKYLYVWQITFSTEKPFGLWVYRVDAESGKILYKADEIMSLKSGSGKAYTSNANWHIGKFSTVSLKNMYSTGDGYGKMGGYMWGLYADVYDNYGNDPFEADYKFLYDPVSDPDWFNATQAYYAINTVRGWWLKTVIAKYGPNPDVYFTSSNPVVTNVDMCNAYYSPSLAPFGVPGFAFGRANSCDAAGSANLVEDWGVVRHEYTHAMMDWLGFDTQFSSPLNYYGRAMGEGNADWFAFLADKKNVFMGDVAWHWSTAGYLRTLDNTRMYPYSVDSGSGLPEEHYTGEIWGNYLYDLYKNLGSSALKYVYQSFPYFNPAGGFMDGYSDFYDAIWAQANSEYDLTGKQTKTFKAWGSMVSRGLDSCLRTPYWSSNYFNGGSYGSDSSTCFGWNFPPYKSISTKGNLLIKDDPHDYTIIVGSAGMKLTVAVTGKTSGMTNPSITLYNWSSPPTIIASGIATSATKATLIYPSLPSGSYTIRVSGTPSAPARGYYGIKISIK